MSSSLAYQSPWSGYGIPRSAWQNYKPQEAFSPESMSPSKEYEAEAESVALTFTLAPKEQMLLNLFTSFCIAGYKVGGWDGYNAKALDMDSLTNLFRLINNLPSFIPIPELVLEPTGELAAVWESKKGELVLSIDSDEKISFSQLDTKTLGQVLGSFNNNDYIFPEQISAILKVMLSEKAR